MNNFLLFFGFKVCWFALILVPSFAIWPVALYWLWSMWRLSVKARTAVVSITAVGCVLDSVLVQSGVFSFVASQSLPFWMVLLWGCFSLVLVQVLAQWLKNWYIAAVVGAMTGPMAYWGGAVLGGQLFYNDITSLLLILAPCWALLLAVAVYNRPLWSEPDVSKAIDAQ